MDCVYCGSVCPHTWNIYWQVLSKKSYLPAHYLEGFAVCCLHSHSEGPITFAFYTGKTLFALLLYLVWNMKLLRIQNTLVRQCSSENLFVAWTHRKKRDSVDTTYKATRILQDNLTTLLLVFSFISFSFSSFLSLFLNHHATLHRPPGLHPIGVTFPVNSPYHFSSSELFMDSSSACVRG